MRYAILKLILVFFLALLGGTVSAKIIYVDSLAAGGGSGSVERPLKYIDKAIQEAKPGDTIYLQPGFYREQIEFVNRHDVTLLGVGEVIVSNEEGRSDALKIAASNNIKIENIRFDSEGNWAKILSSNNITLSRIFYRLANGREPFVINFSKNVVVEDSVFSGGLSFNKVVIRDSDAIRLDRNLIYQSTHTSVQVVDSSDIVVNGNIIIPVWSRAVEFFNARAVSFVGNLVVDSFPGSRSADGSSKLIIVEGDIRENLFVDNYSAPLSIEPYKKQHYVNRLNITDNIFMGNVPNAINIGYKIDQAKGISIIKNYFSENGDIATCGDIRIASKTTAGISIFDNYYSNYSACATGNVWVGSKYKPEQIVQEVNGVGGSSDTAALVVKKGDRVSGGRERVIGWGHVSCDAEKLDFNEMFFEPGIRGLDLRYANNGYFFFGSRYVINRVEGEEFDCFYVMKKKRPNSVVQFDFDGNDEDWIHNWKFYKPYPTGWSSTYSKSRSSNVLYIYNDTKDYFHAEINIKDWDLNSMPIIRFKYKVIGSPPLRLCIKGSGSTDKFHKVCVAGTRKKYGAMRLQSNNKWNSIEVDLTKYIDSENRISVITSLVLEKEYKSLISRYEGIEVDDFYIGGH